MSAQVIQFVPRHRRARPVIGPKILIPNAIEEVFKQALDTSPSEMNPYHSDDKKPA